jgi:ABC-type iron transport system FetAB permease component
VRLWPSDSFEIETTLSPEEIVESLQSAIEPAKVFRFSSKHATFQGKLTADGFKMSRIIHYRNSFLPIIHGTFRAGDSGRIVSIKMRLNLFVAAFMWVWFTGVGLAIFVFTFAFLKGKIQSSPILLIPFGMLVFGWALVSGGFWFEAKKQKPILIAMFTRKNTDRG